MDEKVKHMKLMINSFCNGPDAVCEQSSNLFLSFSRNNLLAGWDFEIDEKIEKCV